MKKVEIPVRGGIVGHSAAVPAGNRGLIWALNCMPVGKEGIALWRPRCQLGTENEDWATIFNPETERLLDMICAYDKMVFLIQNKDYGYCQVAFWKPGEAPDRHAYKFPAPTEEECASISIAGKYLIVAVEGYGLYALDDVSTSGDVFRIGSVFAGMFGESFACVTMTGTTKLLEVQSGEKIFVGTIQLYLFRPDEDKVFKFRLKIETDTNVYYSAETFSSYAVPCGVRGYEGYARVYEPTTFTIDEVIEPPFSVYLEKVEGDMELELESAGKEYIKNGYSVVAGAGINGTPHMNINGALDPTGGITTTTRGLIVGTKEGIRVQFASILDFTFYEEITVDYPIVEMKAFDRGLLVITTKAVFAVTGWSHGGVNSNKLAETGITSRHDVTYASNGAIVYTWGRLEYYGLASANILPLPFLYNLNDKRTYIHFFPEWNLVLVAREDNEYVLAYSLAEKWLVWFRFDEVNKAIPLKSTNGVICFSDGKAYVFSPNDDPEWNGYVTELVHNVGVVDQTGYIAVHKLRINAGIITTEDDQAEINIITSSPNNVEKAKISLKKTVSPTNVGSDVLDVEGPGIPYQFPENRPRLAFLYTPPFVETDVSYYKRDGEEESEQKGLFPTGSSLILHLKLLEGCFKHPGCLLDSFDLYVEEVGRAIQVF